LNFVITELITVFDYIKYVNHKACCVYLADRSRFVGLSEPCKSSSSGEFVEQPADALPPTHLSLGRMLRDSAIFVVLLAIMGIGFLQAL
jgi:hypothetical protein